MRRRNLAIAVAALIMVPWVWWLLPNGLYYQRGRPTRVGRAVNAFSARLYSLGFLPSFLSTLETAGYRTGKTHAIPVVLCDYQGQQYIVSMLGERSPWIRNIRAADGQAVIRRRRRRSVRLLEIPIEERAPIIKAYLGRAIGARPHIPLSPEDPIEDFERIAADYPVFRVIECEPTAEPSLSREDPALV
jgi:hypothetical protein